MRKLAKHLLSLSACILAVPFLDLSPWRWLLAGVVIAGIGFVAAVAIGFVLTLRRVPERTQVGIVFSAGALIGLLIYRSFGLTLDQIAALLTIELVGRVLAELLLPDTQAD